MENIKPKTKHGLDESGGQFFDPMAVTRDNLGRPSVGVPRCCCGFELIKESEDTWRCTGGNHRYRMREGEVMVDKFGTILLKVPVDSKDVNKKGGKKK